ncbi:hypothetical protein J1N09_10100 [Aureitalea sp. L0-47]|uniref:hypothetical protein n=1 Tax=Aureitalea sp. L0-47 TaxID=2816962 RepID=UPI0022384DF5|nr:hypothetical protein [Aureitalea sp. L0-47]MCW5520190.1 hypothetical protein [Aureitalea sp. L0-47]
MWKVEKTENGKVDLEDLIQSTPNKRLVDFYWDAMENFTRKKPKIELKNILTSECEYQDEFDNLFGLMEENIRNYVRDYSEEELQKQLIYHDITISQFNNFIQHERDIDEELYDRLYEYYIAVEVCSEWSIEWFIVKLLEYHKIIIESPDSDYGEFEINTSTKGQ